MRLLWIAFLSVSVLGLPPAARADAAPPVILVLGDSLSAAYGIALSGRS